MSEGSQEGSGTPQPARLQRSLGKPDSAGV
jgi:hypothetical protein